LISRELHGPVLTSGGGALTENPITLEGSESAGPELEDDHKHFAALYKRAKLRSMIILALFVATIFSIYIGIEAPISDDLLSAKSISFVTSVVAFILAMSLFFTQLSVYELRFMKLKSTTFIGSAGAIILLYILYLIFSLLFSPHADANPIGPVGRVLFLLLIVTCAWSLYYNCRRTDLVFGFIITLVQLIFSGFIFVFWMLLSSFFASLVVNNRNRR
jgi:hypothetical protein